jgi:hypothetical protein
MTYAALQTAVIEDTHRPDLTGLVPRFIRECEGMIRRELTAYLLTLTLTDTDRVTASEPIYTLPDGVMVIRRIAAHGQHGPEITRINLGSLTQYDSTHRLAMYAEAGDGTIEFRGNPPDTTTFVMNYYGMPAPLVNDADTNSLLEDHETLYKSGAMFNLYQHTQDRELAGDALSIFTNTIESLNEQVARKIGGAKIAPSYNFSGGSSY